MTTFRGIAAGAVGLALAVGAAVPAAGRGPKSPPAPAAQQEISEWEQVVLDQLAILDEETRSRGYVPVLTNVLGNAGAGQRRRVVVQLAAGGIHLIGGFCDTDCGDVDLRLFDSAGRELTSDTAVDDYPVIQYTPERTGIFEIEVEVVSCSSEPCYFGFAVYAERAAPAEVRSSASGRLASGDATLSAGEYYDRHVFHAQAGQRITVDMSSSQFDTYLIVRDPQRAATQNDDHDGSTDRSRVEIEAAVTGAWEVMATSLKPGETGDYRLDIEVSGAGGATAGGGVTGGGTSRRERGTLQRGDNTLRTGEFVDTFTFEGQPGQTLHVALSSRDFDAYLIVAGPGEERAENDDADGTDSALEMELAEQGTYEVMVTSYEVGEAGNYEITIELDAGAPLALRDLDVRQLLLGERAAGRLEEADGQLADGEYRDVYVFEGVAGQYVTVDMSSRDFDTWVGIIPPSGEAIENDDFDGRTDLSRIKLELPETGRYRIVATSYAAGATGAYEVSLRGEGAAAAPAGDAGNVYGVFVGISDYPGDDNDLSYTAADARLVAEAMTRGARMRAGDGVVLTDAAATAANVRRAIQDVGARLNANDVFVFFFSGHGNRVAGVGPTRSDPDGLDETIELYDAPIDDDELSELLSLVDARVALVVLDACFSGGFAKDVISHPGRMGLFSSEEDVTSQVADKFRAGGYLSQFVAEGVGERQADTDGDGALTALELSQYLHERYRVDVRSLDADEFVRTTQLGNQHLVVDRGSVSAFDVLFR